MPDGRKHNGLVKKVFNDPKKFAKAKQAQADSSALFNLTIKAIQKHGGKGDEKFNVNNPPEVLDKDLNTERLLEKTGGHLPPLLQRAKELSIRTGINPIGRFHTNLARVLAFQKPIVEPVFEESEDEIEKKRLKKTFEESGKLFQEFRRPNPKSILDTSGVGTKPKRK